MSLRSVIIFCRRKPGPEGQSLIPCYFRGSEIIGFAIGSFGFWFQVSGVRCQVSGFGCQGNEVLNTHMKLRWMTNDECRLIRRRRNGIASLSRFKIERIHYSMFDVHQFLNRSDWKLAASGVTYIWRKASLVIQKGQVKGLRSILSPSLLSLPPGEGNQNPSYWAL